MMQLQLIMTLQIEAIPVQQPSSSNKAKNDSISLNQSIWMVLLVGAEAAAHPLSEKFILHGLV